MVRSSLTLPGMTGIRGVAAMAIFFHHYDQVVSLELAYGPFDLFLLADNCRLAVAMFVMLSGFLLSLPYWQARNLDEEMPASIPYLLRRGVRILPAYWSALLILALLQGTYNHAAGLLDLVLHFTFLFTLFEFSHMNLNPVFWTLAIEAQLYLFLPLLFSLYYTLRNRKAVLFLIFTMAAGFLLHALLSVSVTKSIPLPSSPFLLWLRPNGAVVTQSLLALLPHFILGILLGNLFLLPNKHPLVQTVSQWPSLCFWGAAILIIVLLSTSLANSLSSPYSKYGFPFILSILAFILFSAACGGGITFLESQPIKWLGVISYSFYLWHYPCLQLCDILLLQKQINAPEYPIIFFLLSFGASLLAASFSYFIFEKGGRKLLLKYTG